MTEKGQAQAVGEYESSKALFSIIPSNIPRPVAVGTLASNPRKHFLLVEFKDMANELLPVPDFAAVIATLHQQSSSPNGKFGFEVPTSQSLQLENSCATHGRNSSREQCVERWILNRPFRAITRSCRNWPKKGTPKLFLACSGQWNLVAEG
jgi:hypothetical protein